MSLGLIAFGINRGQDPEILVHKTSGIITGVESDAPGVFQITFDGEAEDEFYQVGISFNYGQFVECEIRSRDRTGILLHLTKDAEPYDPSLCVITVSR